jgi:hypothetical protein
MNRNNRCWIKIGVLLLVIAFCACVEPDATFTGILQDRDVDFHNDKGEVTLIPRYFLKVDGRWCLVDSQVYAWSYGELGCTIRISYWYYEGGDFDVSAVGVGDCK